MLEQQHLFVALVLISLHLPLGGLCAPKLSAGAVLCSVAVLPVGDTIQEVLVFWVTPKVLPSMQNSLILADEKSLATWENIFNDEGRER